MIRYDMLPTDCGDLLVAINGRGLVHVDFVAGLRALPDMSGWQQDSEALAPYLAEFAAYFAAVCSALPCRSPPTVPPFSKRYGRHCATFPMARPAVTAILPAPSANRRRYGQWALRTVAIRSRS